MSKPNTEARADKISNIWKKAEEDIMADIIRRIKKEGKITSTADYQLNRLMAMGQTTEQIEKHLREALKKTWPEMFELYDEVCNWQYVRNKGLYEQVNAEFVPPEENQWLQSLNESVKRQTQNTFTNLSRSYGFSVQMGGKTVFLPFSTYYQEYVDNAIIGIITGGTDYNTAIRKAVNQMTNSGFRVVDYGTGRSNRIDVAARRAVLTGVAQLTGNIAQTNAGILGTNHYEVDWHAGARPEHQIWQGKVYTQQELVTVCGLGSVTGLHGANCYHDYYPFVPGVSERLFSDEFLEKMNAEDAKTMDWGGKKYDAYGRTQWMRKSETSMRAQREKVNLLKKAGADEETVTIARCLYQKQLNEYKAFARKAGLETQMERVYYDGRGRIAPPKDVYMEYLNNGFKRFNKKSA